MVSDWSSDVCSSDLPSYDLGYEVVTMDRYREIGAAKSCEIIRERLGDAPVYITFDLDCLDPTIAPAVSKCHRKVWKSMLVEALSMARSRQSSAVGPSFSNTCQSSSLAALTVSHRAVCAGGGVYSGARSTGLSDVHPAASRVSNSKVIGLTETAADLLLVIEFSSAPPPCSMVIGNFRSC